VAPPSRQTLDDSVGQNQKLQRQIVDVQPFVIELHYLACRRIRSTSCAFRARARARLSILQKFLSEIDQLGSTMRLPLARIG
jgi:hypothetical protein